MDRQEEHNKRQEWLDGLKPGDRVHVPDRYDNGMITSVARRTATQIIVGDSTKHGQRFRSSDGYSVSSHTWYGRERIQPVTDEILTQAKTHKIAAVLNQVDWRKEPLDRLERIYDILGEGTSGGAG